MPLDVVCPDGYALYKAESCYHRFDDLFPTTPSGRKKRSNGPYDRLWIWECRAVSQEYIHSLHLWSKGGHNIHNIQSVKCVADHNSKRLILG